MNEAGPSLVESWSERNVYDASKIGRIESDGYTLNDILVIRTWCFEILQSQDSWVVVDKIDRISLFFSLIFNFCDR